MSYIDKIEIEIKVCLKNFIARITLAKFEGFMEEIKSKKVTNNFSFKSLGGTTIVLIKKIHFLLGIDVKIAE
jgi:hypothetical protein